AQTGPATGPATQPATWKSLSFLEGTWEAKAQGAGGAQVSGLYTFQSELGGHILARHSSTDPNCKGPVSFDCEHGDLLYIFEDGPGGALKAIYFDNEGHVIHYDVSTPTATTALFLSEPGPGPKFRLTYERKGALMSGAFQMQAPRQTEWRSYLEWSGARK
ncbi:MAG TPA: hypothetical protein VGD62_08215, partial [Acidobacteriaceae bacterium]